MKKFELNHQSLTPSELRNFYIASLQNQLSIERGKDKCLCGEDEPAKKERKQESNLAVGG
jgi:hypothetical protein|tara:strand:- start:42 stop:221 length:180 start_codon:yes stop_codon:yes gene_type:complete